LLSIIDIFVLPSIQREGLGISIIEAMAMGKPVVASKIGGIPEAFIHGVNGLTVEPGDIKNLSKSMHSLLVDREKAQRMGKEGKRIYEEKFSAKIMTENIQALYATAIRRKRL
jgi:glycosyltransferase involved in cell wall biosynthesis